MSKKKKNFQILFEKLEEEKIDENFQQDIETVNISKEVEDLKKIIMDMSDDNSGTFTGV